MIERGGIMMRKILLLLIVLLIAACSQTNATIPRTYRSLDESDFKPFYVEATPKVYTTPFIITEPKISIPKKIPSREVITKPKTKIIKTLRTNNSAWKTDYNISWYGPGFYGHRTACGLALTKTLIGVAHRTLPCGTIITFKWGNKVISAPVVDRGPYVGGRQFDMTGGLCVALHHCFTGKIYYRVGR
jgi:rare lipoprotein A (peptidoglycan hydrolase)